MSGRVLVLEQPPGDEDGLARVRDAIGEAGVLGYPFRFADAEELSEAANRYLWLGARPEEAIAVLDDFDIGVRYVELVLATEERARALADLLAARLPVVPLAELKRRVAQHLADDPGALVRLALAAGTGDDETIELITRSVGHADAKVRRAAAMAATMVRSPALAAVLHDAAASEPETGLRDLFTHAARVTASSDTDAQP